MNLLARNEVLLSIWPFICKRAIQIGMAYHLEPAELAQAAAEKVLGAFALYESIRGKPTTYLGAVAINAMISVVRKAKAERRRTVPLGSYEPCYVSDQAKLLTLENAIASLPKRLGSIIRMRLDSFTCEEVAMRLGISRPQVSVLQRRAYGILRAALTPRTRPRPRRVAA